MMLTIFLVFLRISFLSFGGVFGVLPELERMVVLEHGWLTHEKFLQAYVIGQLVPGPNMAMCSLIGYWIAGWSGFLAAFAGIYSGPVLMMSAGYAVYHRNRQRDWVRRVERSVRPLILGLLSAAALRVFWLQTSSGASEWLVRILGVVLIAICWLALRKKIVGPFMLIFLAGVLWFGMVSLTVGVH